MLELAEDDVPAGMFHDDARYDVFHHLACDTCQGNGPLVGYSCRPGLHLSFSNCQGYCQSRMIFGR